MYKEPRLVGKDDDGEYLARIEEIGISKNYDTLYISNRKTNCWVFSILTGYRQIGIFKVLKPHNYKEWQDIIVKKKDGKIICVEPDTTKE